VVLSWRQVRLGRAPCRAAIASRQDPVGLARKQGLAGTGCGRRVKAGMRPILVCCSRQHVARAATLIIF
jgi:hypothetical protein